jgi:hypothetical protein
MRSFISIVAIFCTVNAFAEDLGEWLAANEPRVEHYLLKLSNKELNQPLAGIALSDGTKELKGYVFLGNFSDPARGLHDYMFHAVYSGVKYETHYMWLDKNVPKLYLPPYLKCTGEFIEPGGVTVLSGDQYTYAYLHPGGELVVTMCKLNAQQGAPGDAQKAARP